MAASAAMFLMDCLCCCIYGYVKQRKATPFPSHFCFLEEPKISPLSHEIAKPAALKLAQDMFQMFH